jgi:hypothetical protein
MPFGARVFVQVGLGKASLGAAFASLTPAKQALFRRLLACLI